MKTTSSPFPARRTRLGFHYYPDTLHYTSQDLQDWLPHLHDMNISWLVLQGSPERAIPEYFISGLLEAGIEPIIHYPMPIFAPPNPAEFRPILSAYARWGVHGVIWFDRPNARKSWTARGWAQQDLVDRFLDRWIPYANTTLQCGVNPVLSPLEPDGSYWDTAFLRQTLEALERRKQNAILQNLVLSCYAWTWNRPMNWGAGGPGRWNTARPYTTSDTQPDQLGFRIFDWYDAITRSVLGDSCPIIMLGMGAATDPARNTTGVDPHLTLNAVAAGRLLLDQPAVEPANPSAPLDPIPSNVIAGNYWLLAADSDHPLATQTWFQGEQHHAAVEQLARLQVRETTPTPDTPGLDTSVDTGPMPAEPVNGNGRQHPIHHYLLLPLYEFGVADWHLNVIRPYVKKYRPTVGFSLAEAALASRVTVLGGPQTFPEEMLERLRHAGIVVERINGDGTSIATQLAER